MRHLSDLVMPTFIIMGALAIVGWLSFYMNSGLDITDESFYLLQAQWIDNTVFNNTRFGHYLGIMMRLANHDISLVRILGLFLLAMGCISIAVTGTRYIEAIHTAQHSRIRVAIIASIAVAGGTLYYGWWLTTPSYNWFVLSCSLFAFALVFSLSRILYRNSGQAPLINSFAIWIRCAAISICIVVCFFCKAPSSAALSLLVCVFLALNLHHSNLFGVLTLMSIIGLSAAIAHLYLFEGGVINYLTTIETSLYQRNLRDGGSQMLDVLPKFWDGFSSIPSHSLQTLPAAFLCSAIMLPLHIVRKFRTLSPVLFSVIKRWLIVGLIAVGAFELYEHDYLAMGFVFTGEALCALSCLVIWAAVIAPARYDRALFDSASFRTLAVAIIVFLLAFAFSFGTSNPLLRQTSLTGVFYFLTILFVVTAFDLEANDNWGVIIVSLVSLTITILVLSKTMSAPYRLPSALSEQKFPIKVPINGKNAILKVDRATAEYITLLQASAKEAGWLPGNPIIDLTGGTPAAALVLGGHPVGAPWILGGYPGSEATAAYLLSLEKRNLLRASWLLTAQEGIRKIPLSILTDLKLHFPEDYIQVVRLTTGHRNESQILWKPANTLVLPSKLISKH